MVAAASLGDVVKKSSQVEHFLVLEISDQPRAQRIFVRMLRLGESAQVADHHQDVLVDGIHMEEIVLHLADDPSERRQILAQHAKQIHSAQLVRQAARLAKHLDEARAIGRLAAKRDVDAVPFTP